MDNSQKDCVFLQKSKKKKLFKMSFAKLSSSKLSRVKTGPWSVLSMSNWINSTNKKSENICFMNRKMWLNFLSYSLIRYGKIYSLFEEACHVEFFSIAFLWGAMLSSEFQMQKEASWREWQFHMKQLVSPQRKMSMPSLTYRSFCLICHTSVPAYPKSISESALESWSN